MTAAQMTSYRSKKRHYQSPGQLAWDLLGADPQQVIVGTYQIKNERPGLLYREECPIKRRREGRLVARHIPLLKTIIKQQLHKYGSIGIDEMYSLGLIALLKAVRRFDPERGYKFSSIALPFIIGEWRHWIRDKGFWLTAPGHVRMRGMAARRLLASGDGFEVVAKKLGIAGNQLRLDLRATNGMGQLDSMDGQFSCDALG